jgi:hypothetical protein
MLTERFLVIHFDCSSLFDYRTYSLFHLRPSEAKYNARTYKNHLLIQLPPGARGTLELLKMNHTQNLKGQYKNICKLWTNNWPQFYNYYFKHNVKLSFVYGYSNVIKLSYKSLQSLSLGFPFVSIKHRMEKKSIPRIYTVPKLHLGKIMKISNIYFVPFTLV